MVFHWRLSDSESPQVSRTLFSILAVFNNAVVWMVSTQPSTSKSSRPFNNLLVTVPKAPITIGIISIFMFHSFFNYLARSRYLSLFSHSFSFILWSAKSTILQIFFSLLIIIRSGLLAEIRWSVCMSKSQFVCVIFYDRCWVVHIPFVGMVKFKYLAHFPVDHLAHTVVSSLILLLCQFAAFAYYMIDCFICHRIAYICYFVASYLSPPWYDWFLCAAIRRDSVSHLKFPFLSHVQVLSCEMLFISRFKTP